MNPKFKLVLFNRGSEKGFAFPLALLTGLVMVMAGLTMISRSQSDESKVLAQQVKADGLSVAEVAVTEIQNLINSNRHLSTANSQCSEGETECWQNLTTSPTSGSWTDPDNQALTQLQRDFVQNLINEKLEPKDKCPIFDESEKKALENKITQIKSNLASDSQRIDEVVSVTQSSSDDLSSWKSLKQKDAQKGVDPYRYYRMMRYEYNKVTKQGTLVVEGLYRTDQLAQDNKLSSSKVDNSQSISRLAVTFPVQLPSLDPVIAGPTAPGLWIRQGATNIISKPIKSDGTYDGNTRFQANVVMSDVCGFSKDQQKKISNFITGTHINPYEVSPQDYSAGFVNQDLPPLPEILDDLEDISAASFTTPPNIYHQLSSSQKNLTINQSSFTGDAKNNLVYPKDPKNDKTIAIKLNNGQTVNYYTYIIDSIDLTANKKITIQYGQKVLFLVKGNIKIKGNGAIEHNCLLKPFSVPSSVTCEATDFLVMAYADPAKTSSPEICIKGNAQMDAVIYAPEYHVGLTGNDAKYRGSVWARDWGKISDCSSVGNHVAIKQSAKYDLLPEGMIPKPEGLFINSITSWRQCSVEETVDSCINPDTVPDTSPSPAP